MTDYDGNAMLEIDVVSANQEGEGNPSTNFIFFNTIDSITNKYLMRAIDPDCGGLTYRTWVVSDAPDLTGAQYSGTKCGGSALTEIVIAAQWSIVAVIE